jgi:uncharacterized protein YgbK (DUF1537 family)
MIAVIADDLTGAAELGGVGLRYGFSVEIVTSFHTKTDADILIIATNTRSMTEQQAIAEMARISTALFKLKPDLIFKKVDSVLRGHVVAELHTHLKKLDLQRALLIPANPSLGRTIVDGHYFLNNQPIHLSSFSNDPDFPIGSSSVLDMLRTDKDTVHICSKSEDLPLSGITTGECAADEDFKLWLDKTDKQTLIAGASGLFKALLEKLKLPGKATQPDNELIEPALFVCGSAFNKSKQLVEDVKFSGGPVSYMPRNIAVTANPDEQHYDKWADEVVGLLNTHQKAIIAFQESPTMDIETVAGSLREKKAYLVEKLLQRTEIKELLIEGGATASAIIKRLELNTLVPVNEFSTGVIRMKANEKEDLFLTLKPGSYNWPETLWNFQNSNDIVV